MNRISRHSRLLVPALALVAAGAVTGFFARSESSAPIRLHEVASAQASATTMALSADDRYVPFETGEVLPFDPKAQEPTPAPVPEPEAEEWNRLSNLTVAAVTTSTRSATEMDMPAPAGFDESLDALERSRLVAARSVENEGHRVSSCGPGFRIGLSNVCIPGVDE